MMIEEHELSHLKSVYLWKYLIILFVQIEGQNEHVFLIHPFETVSSTYILPIVSLLKHL